MKNIIVFLSIILWVSFAHAGTPPVMELKVLSDTVVELSQDAEEPTTIICAYGTDNQEVIPSEWYVEPSLPDGLYLERGEGSDKSKLYLKGVPKKKSNFKHYKVWALNNGNKVKNIAAASAGIDIVVHAKSAIFATVNNELTHISFPDFTYKDVSFPFQLNETQSMVSVKDKIAFAITRGIAIFDTLTQEYTVVKIASPDSQSDSDKIHVVFNGENFVGVRCSRVPSLLPNQVVEISPTSKSIVRTISLDLDQTIEVPFFIDGSYVFSLLSNSTNKPKLVFFNKSFEKTNEITFDNKVTNVALSDTQIAFTTKDSNNLKIYSPKAQELKEMEVKNFDLHSTASEDKDNIKCVNNTFLMKIMEPIFRQFFILKIVNENEMIPLFIGAEELLDFDYGNGFIAAITDRTLMLFEWGTNKKVFETNLEPGLSTIEFVSDHFIITSLDGVHFFNPGTKKTVFRNENPYNHFILPKDEPSIALADKNITTFINKNTLSVNETNISGRCFAITNDEILTFEKSFIYLYKRSNFELIKAINTNVTIDDIVYDKETNELFIVDASNDIVYKKNLSDSLEKTKVFSDKGGILKVFIHNQILFVWSSLGLYLVEKENDPIQLAKIEWAMSIHHRKCKIKKYNEKITLLFNKDIEHSFAITINSKTKQIDLDLWKNFPEGINFYDLEIISENTVACLTPEGLCLIDLNNPPNKDNRDPLKHQKYIITSIEAYDMAFANERIVIPTSSAIIIIDVNDFSVETIPTSLDLGFSQNGIFFSDNKFFIEEKSGNFTILDGIHNKLLGNFQIPTFIENITTE